MRHPLETHLHDPPRRTARCGSRAALAVLLMLGGCSGASGPEEAPAPDCESVIVRYPGDVGQVGDVEHVHDPAIVRHGDTYYVYSTNDGIPIRRSRDLVRWERVGRVFEAQLPPWARSEVPGAEAPWAPEIAYFHGRFHLYYSLSTFGSQRSVIGMATNVTLDPEHPDYRWTGQGRVLESWTGASRYNAIDPDVVLDSDGLPWLSWGSHWGGLYLRRLDAAGSGQVRPDGQLERCRAEGTWDFQSPWLRMTWRPTSTTGRTRVETAWVSEGGRWLVGRSQDGKVVRGYRITSP